MRRFWIFTDVNKNLWQKMIVSRMCMKSGRSCQTRVPVFKSYENLNIKEAFIHSIYTQQVVFVNHFHLTYADISKNTTLSTFVWNSRKNLQLIWIGFSAYRRNVFCVSSWFFCSVKCIFWCQLKNIGQNGNQICIIGSFLTETMPKKISFFRYV